MIYVILDKNCTQKYKLIDKIINNSSNDVLIIDPHNFKNTLEKRQMEKILSNPNDKDIIVSGSFAGIINYTPPILRNSRMTIYYINCCKTCITPLLRLYNFSKYIKNVYPTYEKFKEYVYSIGNNWLVIDLPGNNDPYPSKFTIKNISIN